MFKKIFCVYQDCPMCGARKKWGDEQLKEAGANKWNIEKISFASPEGAEFIRTAVYEKKIKSLPFFTDGEGHFALTVKELKDEIKGAKKDQKKAKNSKIKEGACDEPA